MLFHPAGVVAAGERNLIITIVIVMLLLVLPVVFGIYFVAWKYRAKEGDGRHAIPEGKHGMFREIVWWFVPLIAIGVLSMITWATAHRLDPQAAVAGADPNAKPFVVQVIALNWKWLFIYPEQGIATVNFVEFPAATPLEFDLTADAPMNAFWIPQLGTQMYAMPAMVNRLHLIANAPGEFPGTETEINGDGYAGMRFMAKAVLPDDFDAWAASVKQGTSTLNGASYAALAAPSQNYPVTFYASTSPGLYAAVVMKYMAPIVSSSTTMDMNHDSR